MTSDQDPCPKIGQGAPSSGELPEKKLTGPDAPSDQKQDTEEQGSALSPSLTAALEAATRYNQETAKIAEHGEPASHSGKEVLPEEPLDSIEAVQDIALTKGEEQSVDEGSMHLAVKGDSAIVPQSPADPLLKEDEDADDADEDAEDEDADEEEEATEEDHPMTLREHLKELRVRLFRCFVIVVAGACIWYTFAEDLFSLVMQPFVEVLPATQKKFMYVAPAEAFFAYMRMSIVASLFSTSPLVFYQVWAFIAPGLHKEERTHLLPLAFFSALFFSAGALFCYYVTFPVVFQFLMSFNSELIESRPSMQDSLSFVLQLLVAFGLIFELPLFVFFLARLGLVTAAWMRKVRRYAILASFILAAILTPPDVYSQMLMAAPLLVLYEGSIFVAAVFGKKKPESSPTEDSPQEATSANSANAEGP